MTVLGGLTTSPFPFERTEQGLESQFRKSENSSYRSIMDIKITSTGRSITLSREDKDRTILEKFFSIYPQSKTV